MDMKQALAASVASLPTLEELRRRLAQNLQERQLIRQILRIVEKKAKLSALNEEQRNG
jgi:hypothetical protein